MLHKKASPDSLDQTLNPTFGSRYISKEIPRYRMPDEEMPPKTAAQIIHDELMLDGNARLNLATFVTTWMEPEAKELMQLTFEKNMVDKDEYPQTAEIEMRCVNIMSELYNAPEDEKPCGCSTIGSSEAAMLGGMALKWMWRKRREAAGKPADKPNLILGIDVQVCWEKFCRYWEIEPRYIPIERGRYMVNSEEVIKRCDENTIGVVGILGTTFTGQYEPIKEINDALDELNAKTGWDVPLHVDAASGGFVAPFLQPDLEWDFRLKWVKSINVSGHKYGLVYPGVGWIIWRDEDELPEELVFKVNYLGGDMPTFALNFSRPGNQVIAQYYNFIRLGRDGYRRVMETSRDTARFLTQKLPDIGPFEILGPGEDIPVLAFRIREDADVNYTVFDISEHIRHRGWLIPAYTLPENAEDIAVLRIVVKEDFSRDMATLLLEDMTRVIADYASQPDRIAAQDSSTDKHRPKC
ncbi:MAG: glutamate decarboxylase [Verrucomicrobiota bacterium]